MKLYLAGPMTGHPYFNFPKFKVARENLRAQGYYVFCPAEEDIRRHGGVDFSVKCPKGDPSELEGTKFSLRESLYHDTKFICLEADGIALMPGWEKSQGARAEHALALALSLEFIYLR